MSLVAYGDSSSDSEIDEGDGASGDGPPEEKKSDVRKMLGLLPPPKGSKSGKQPVRISLPAVKAGNDSEDEEEGEPQLKRVKTGGGSKLTALLPQPKAIPKQLGEGKTLTTTTRSMVPYTLSKRKQQSIKSERAKSMKTKSRGKMPAPAHGDGSDSDEEPVSFFSHLEDTASTGTSVTEKDTKSISMSGGSITPSPAVPISLSEHVASSSVSSTSPAYSTAPLMDHHDIHHTTSTYTHSSIGPSFTASGGYNPPNSAPSHPNSQQMQTHTDSSQYSWDQLTRGTHPAPAPYPTPAYTPQQYIDGHATQSTNVDASYSVVQPQSDTGGDGVGGDSGGSGEGGEVMGGAGPGVIIDQEALRRLAGGSMKRRGRREEALNNIMDVMGDDVMDNIKVYQRHYGEDPSITKLYKVDNSKLKTPSGQQKRKHQITWLAHEAKERELELQKQWAVGSQARSNSRSKYGF